MKLFNPIFIPHKGIVYNNINPQYGLTINCSKELIGHCLGLNIYFNRKIIHLGLHFTK